MRQLRQKLRTDGTMDGRADRPYFIGPFRVRPVVQKSIDCRFFGTNLIWVPLVLSGNIPTVFYQF